uniref:C2 domain-containing protein n=1 Tax=Fagus sylvatica TaxID=28930 RepID=A0A2N9F3K3_FAGSY
MWVTVLLLLLSLLVFALRKNRPDSASATLEISIWDLSSEQFLGGVCLDLSNVPVRDPLDSPLALQWYRLEGVATDQHGGVSGDIRLAIWIGTQADDAFPEAWHSDVPYLGVTVIEAVVSESYSDRSSGPSHCSEFASIDGTGNSSES